jgi:hypothetical protein
MTDPVRPRDYLQSLPERLVRAIVGLGAGLTREVGDVVVPAGVRDTQLYQNLDDTTLRFLIEQVGSVDSPYKAASEPLPDDFLIRRTAGNALEVLGLVAFRASPVWVLAALADVSGAGRRLIPEIAQALKADGLLEHDTEFTSVDQLLDGLERTSARLAQTVNTPPLDATALRGEWQAIRAEARALQPSNLPSLTSLEAVWQQLKSESERQGRSVFETSSTMALTAARGLPDGVRWLSAAAVVSARRTGHVVGAALLDYYSTTLTDIRRIGFGTYAARQMRPYLRAAAGQFSPSRRTLTERAIEWRRRRRR